jgi:hypothetical protein
MIALPAPDVSDKGGDADQRETEDGDDGVPDVPKRARAAHDESQTDSEHTIRNDFASRAGGDHLERYAGRDRQTNSDLPNETLPVNRPNPRRDGSPVLEAF